MDTQKIEEQVSLTGKVAIVTGAGTELGRSVAEMLADTGAAVLLVADSDIDEATKTQQLIRAEGGRVHLMQADPCSVDDAQRVSRAAVDRFGGLDILVCNSVALPRELQATGSLWKRVVDANLRGVSWYCRAAAQRMIALGHGGKIVNVTHRGGLRTVGGAAEWLRPNENIEVLSKILADEFEPYRIHVNAVSHGLVQTPRMQMQAAGLLRSTGTNERGIPRVEPLPFELGPTPESEDVATVVLFLLSPAASDITGQLVVVDGAH